MSLCLYQVCTRFRHQCNQGLCTEGGGREGRGRVNVCFVIYIGTCVWLVRI